MLIVLMRTKRIRKTRRRSTTRKMTRPNTRRTIRVKLILVKNGIQTMMDPEVSAMVVWITVVVVWQVFAR